MMAGKVAGLEFEIISKLDSYSLMVVKIFFFPLIHTIMGDSLYPIESYIPEI